MPVTSNYHDENFCIPKVGSTKSSQKFGRQENLKSNQIKALTDDNRINVSVTASIAEMIENPYVIFEQYTGYDAEDTIPLYKIDNGVIPSPQYGTGNLLDVDSAERFRAFCVDELKKISRILLPKH